MHRNVFGALLAGLLLGAWLADGASRRWEGWPEGLLGETGVLPFVVSVTSVILLAIGASMALNNHRLALKNHFADRFREATEMVASSKLSSRLTGLSLIGGLIRDERNVYGPAGIQTMAACMDEADSDVSAAVSTWVRGSPPVELFHRPSDRSTAGALNDLARAFPQGDWPKDSQIVHNGKLMVGNVFLSQTGFVDEQFTNIFIARLVVDQVQFTECKIIGCALDGFVGRHLRFIRCDLSGTILNLGCMDVSVSPPARSVVDFENCSGTDTCTINGIPLSNWIAQRDFAEAAAAED